MMTLWTGFKQQNCASDNKIGPNEEEEDSTSKSNPSLPTAKRTLQLITYFVPFAYYQNKTEEL